MSTPVSEEDLRKWHRYFAIEGNNAAWPLAEKPELSVAEKSELLLQASTSANHWFKVGTESNIALAHQLIGWVHARLGNGELALYHAELSYNSITSRETASWEVAFAHAILAAAAAVSGDSSRHATHYAEASRVGEGLDPEDKEIFMGTFRLVPVP